MIDEVRFSWDAKKAQSNVRKHDISFDEALSVFDDVHARLIPDPDHSQEEERFILLGLSHASSILTVVHCYRDEQNIIRIISARKSTKFEEKQYKEYLL
jgi:uncharacterized DUF497 family protein